MTEVERFVAVTARALIDHCGVDAGCVAATRADAKLGRRDPDGAAMWRRIVKEIERLQAIEPEGPVN